VRSKSTRRCLDKLEREYDEISPRELPGAVRNLSTTAGIHEDKAANLRGDPTTVIEHRSYKEVVDKLKQMGVIEGDAEEMPEDQPALQRDLRRGLSRMTRFSFRHPARSLSLRYKLWRVRRRIR
jgi:hypothetical protein